MKVFFKGYLLMILFFYVTSCEKESGINFTIHKSGTVIENVKKPELILNNSEERIHLFLDTLERDCYGKTFLDLHIKNTGTTSLKIKGELNKSSWNNGAVMIPPGENNILRLYFRGGNLDSINPYAKLKGMNGLPNGHMWLWERVDVSNIKEVKLQLLNNAEKGTFVIDNMKSGGDVWQDTMRFTNNEFYPFVDKFGQYKHKNWKGKTLKENSLEENAKKEYEELSKYKSNKNLDVYSGWENGPQLTKTGHFYVEKHQGKWWLVTPEGHLFWSQGLNCVRYTQTITRVDGRENYFENLPNENNNLSKFYSSYKNYKGYSFSEANLYRKHGEDWQKIAKERMQQRLKNWGINTIGNWSDPNVYEMQKTPYTVNLGYKFPGRLGALKMPNMCSPDFEKNLVAAMKNYKKTINDPFCIGYFVNNELHGWAEISKVAIAAKKGSYEKQAWLQFLKNEYLNITALNKQWKSTFLSWNALSENTNVAVYKNSKQDVENFNYAMIDRYYATIKRVLKKHAPNKLYLGSRLDFHNYPNVGATEKKVVEIASKYCDVLSFNRYNYTASEIKFDKKVTDVPVIIGEFHFGALDRGMPHTGLRSALNQQQRAELYYNYVISAIENPQIVGAHWFQYQELPVTGRDDGENYQIGFVDICDTPNKEIIEKSKRIGDEIFDVRTKSTTFSSSPKDKE